MPSRQAQAASGERCHRPSKNALPSRRRVTISQRPWEGAAVTLTAPQTGSVGTTAMSDAGGTPAASPLNWAAVPSLCFLTCCRELGTMR